MYKVLAALSICIIFLFTSCSPSTPPASVDASSLPSQSSAAAESSNQSNADEANAFDLSNPETLNERPQMSAENQEYADKYLGPAQYTLIRYSFSEEDFTPIISDGWGTFAMLAEDFYRINEQGEVDENLYADFWKKGADGFPAEFFEGAIQQYLRIPSKDIQEAFGELYSAEQGRYLFEDGRGGPGYITAIVTDVKDEADIIQLNYDAFWVLPDDNGDGVVYQYDFSGLLTIETEGNSFYYTSNQI